MGEGAAMIYFVINRSFQGRAAPDARAGATELQATVNSSCRYIVVPVF
jgi:hypothetical protein